MNIQNALEYIKYGFNPTPDLIHQDPHMNELYKFNHKAEVYSLSYPWHTQQMLDRVDDLYDHLDYFIEVNAPVTQRDNVSIYFHDDDKKYPKIRNTEAQQGGVALFHDDGRIQVAVNIKDTATIVHEFGHVYDRLADGQAPAFSERPEFQKILEAYNNEVDKSDLIGRSKDEIAYREYLKEPTEVFARLFQAHYLKEFGTDPLTEMRAVSVGEIIANQMIFEYPEITQYFSDHIPHITYESSRAFKECLDYIEADIESVINLK